MVAASVERPLTLALSPEGLDTPHPALSPEGRGFSKAPSPSERERGGVRVGKDI